MAKVGVFSSPRATRQVWQSHRSLFDLGNTSYVLKIHRDVTFLGVIWCHHPNEIQFKVSKSAGSWQKPSIWPILHLPLLRKSPHSLIQVRWCRMYCYFQVNTSKKIENNRIPWSLVGSWAAEPQEKLLSDRLAGKIIICCLPLQSLDCVAHCYHQHCWCSCTCTTVATSW